MVREPTDEELTKIELAKEILSQLEDQGRCLLPPDMAMGILTSFPVEELRRQVAVLRGNMA